MPLSRSAPPGGRDPPRPVAVAPARRCRRPPAAAGPPRAAPKD